MDDNQDLPIKKSESILFTRYKQLLSICLAACSLVFINFLLNSESFTPTFNLPRFIFLASVIASCIVSLLLSAKSERLSIMVSIWSLVLAITYGMWVGGGLKASSNVVYPALMMIAALLLSTKSSRYLFAFIIVAIAFMGAAEIHSINPYKHQPFSYENVINILIVITLAGLGGWQIGKDYRTSLNKLKEENIKNIQSQNEIHYLAHHDSLTGLSNLQSAKSLYTEMQKNKQYKIHFYFLDLDDFKTINDTYNHSMGDELLTQTAKRLSSITPEKAIIARMGGDEFLLITQHTDISNADNFAKSILKVITQPYLLSGTSLDITTSIGIAVSPHDGISFDEVRKKADIAMYKAKQKGKNHYQYYNDFLHQEVLRKNIIIKGLKQALKDDDLSLHLQSKYHLATGKLVGAEALVRWTKNNIYNIQPDEFIPVIESTDLIVELGEWVIKEACQICKRWHNNGHTHMKIAINISAMQLSRHSLEGSLTQALKRSQLDPQYIEIELTEHLLLKQSQKNLQQLDNLRKMGITIAIDDFGTGYSNLSYLSRFNVNALKLDHSFTYQLDQRPEDLAIVKAIISMANIMGLKTIAEGIENKQVWKILESLGCELGQGFYWGKPLDEDHFNASYMRTTHSSPALEVQ